MLTDLLRLLSAGGLYAMEDVAQRLGVSEALVGEMADGLARRGYLAPLDTCSTASCDGCGLASMCGLKGGSRRTLMLTAKGRQAAARN